MAHNIDDLVFGMERTSGEICCRLCFCSNGNFLNIFNDAPSVFDIAELLKKHFQDEVDVSDPLPNIICSDCWRKTESFHEFHEKVLSERDKYLASHLDKIAIKTEPESISVAEVTGCQFDEFDVNICVDPITVIKPIPIDNPNNTHNGHEPFSNISTDFKNEIFLPENDGSIFYGVSVIKEDIESEYELCSGTEENQHVDDTDKLLNVFNMKCDVCKNVFESLEKALTHYNQMHNDQNGYIKCCNLQFKDVSLASDHLKWHLNPEQFKCDQCEEIRSTRKDLQSHIRAVHSSRRFICDYCDKSFKAKQKLEIHMLGVHIHVKMSHRCGICKKRFKTFKQLHTHLESTHPDDLSNFMEESKNIPLLDLNDERMKAASDTYVDQTCDICHVQLNTLAGAKKHYLIQHRHPKGYIKCCKLKLPGKMDLINHLNWHINPNIFRCRLCLKTCGSRRAINHHMKKHETLQSKRFTCDTCSDIFPTFEDHRSHMETMHDVTITKRTNTEDESIPNPFALHKDPERFKCDQCERKFKHKRSLLIHQAENHMNKLIKCRICYQRFDTNATLADHLLAHQEKQQFPCPDPECERSFFSERFLNAHLDRGHQITNEVQICEFCAKVFKSKSLLKLHCRNMHEQGPPKPKLRFKCDICSKFYSSKGILRTHILNHNTGPFQCTVENCNKIAPTTGALALHMKAVHAEAKFKCHLCDRAFKLAHSLKDHVATHLNKKQYKCTYCDMEFIWRTNMYKHRKLVHRAEWEADKAKKDAEKKMP